MTDSLHLALPLGLAAILVGAGVYGILARRNAVLVLIGVELILNAANLILVTLGSQSSSPLAGSSVLVLFVITVAAAEITVALAIVLAMFRQVGHIDLTRIPEPEPIAPQPAPQRAPQPEPLPEPAHHSANEDHS